MAASLARNRAVASRTGNPQVATHSGLSGSRVARFVLAAGLLGLAAFCYLTWTGLSHRGWILVDNIVYDAIFVLAGVACVMRAVSRTQERLAWSCFALGIFVAAGGYIYYSVFLQALASPPYPSVADALWFGLYPFAYAGLVLLARARLKGGEPKYWLDGLVAALALGAVGVALFLPIVGSLTGGEPSTVATNLVYTIGDLTLLGYAGGLWLSYGKQLGRAWGVLVLAICINFAGDVVYLVQTSSGTYVDGSLVDVSWPLAMMLIALAAWTKSPRATPASSKIENLRVVLPTVLAAICAGVLIYGNFEPLEPAATLLAAGGLLGSIVRALVSARQLSLLRGLLPICAGCKSIREDSGYWTQIEAYVSAHSAAVFNHSICPDCATELYPEHFVKDTGGDPQASL